MRVPFTATQRQELERQTMIYKYMMASAPVPPQLLLPITNTPSNFAHLHSNRKSFYFLLCSYCKFSFVPTSKCHSFIQLGYHFYIEYFKENRGFCSFLVFLRGKRFIGVGDLKQLGSRAMEMPKNRWEEMAVLKRRNP